MTLSLPYSFGSGTVCDRAFTRQLQIDLAYLLANVRQKLTAPLTINVPADFATVQAAYDAVAANFDFGGQAVKIKVANGTITTPLIVSQPWLGGGSLTIEGDTATPANVVWSTTSADNVKVTCVLPGLLTVQGFKHQTTTGGSALRHEGGGTLQYGACNFGACVQNHVFTRFAGANISAISAYALSGGAGTHFTSNNNGAISSSVPVVITVSGSPAFSPGPNAGFANANNGGIILANLFSFAGTFASVTGKRYFAQGNGTIFTNGGGPLFFPGDVAGTASADGYL